ncbi:ATP-grasp domain-containing protein [Lysobacter brunescens]|uniref:ATP-grasp domain-containing protein n=1 Tax=Lysobacter brunescens TaxID=262323 RepID=A0ABW2YLR4_9GAMM
MNLERAELLLIEDRVAILASPTGVAAYDFDFRLHFDCRHPYRIDGEVGGVLRVGAPTDYTRCHEDARTLGVRPINDSEQHLLASEIERWYPLIEDATPKTMLFDALPDVDVVEAIFGWPVFLKGSRQTSKHNPELSVIRDRTHYAQARIAYARDPILHWQKPVLRAFTPLAPVAGHIAGKIRPSIEFRTFWLHGRCIGHGPYWYQVPPYRSDRIDDGLSLAASVAARVPVPFLVVDLALTAENQWIVIECNDAQESGHAGIPPPLLWRNLLDAWT